MPVVRPSASFVTSLIAETLSERPQHLQQSQTNLHEESGGTSDTGWSSLPPKLASCSESGSYNYNGGVLRYPDGPGPRERVGVESPVATYAQEDVEIERFSPYLEEDFSPLRSLPIAPLPNIMHLGRESIPVQKPFRVSDAPGKSIPPPISPALSPSPSLSPPPRTRSTRPISSLPVPNRSRRQRPRIPRADLDRESVWSTLPSRKRKAPASEGCKRKGGITTTARFSLPVALPPTDNALAGNSSSNMKSTYRPPPRPLRAESKGENHGRGSQETDTGFGSSDDGATGWRIVKITPSMLKDPKFSGTSFGEPLR